MPHGVWEVVLTSSGFLTGQLEETFMVYMCWTLPPTQGTCVSVTMLTRKPVAPPRSRTGQGHTGAQVPQTPPCSSQPAAHPDCEGAGLKAF